MGGGHENLRGQFFDAKEKHDDLITFQKQLN